jgi:hypothetical protein
MRNESQNTTPYDCSTIMCYMYDLLYEQALYGLVS